MTLDEFRKLPMRYTFGMRMASGAQRMYRNEEHGLQREVYTPCRRGVWGKGSTSFFLDGHPGEFKTVAELYAAWCEKRGVTASSPESAPPASP